MDDPKNFFASILIFVLSCIPIGIFFLIKNLLSPEGFWQNFVVCGVGAYFLGGIQILFWIIAGYLIYAIWAEIRR